MENLYLALEDEHYQALKNLQIRSNSEGLRQLVMHLGLLVVLGSAVGWVAGTVWYWPIAFAYGVVLTFLFAPLHECLHNTAFKSRLLNDWVGKLIGLVLILPRDYFRCFHFAHHRHTQLPDKDPELAQPKPDSLGTYLRYVSGAGYWREQILLTIKHALGSVNAPFISKQATSQVIKEARVNVLIYTLVIAVSVVAEHTAALIYWFIPMLLGQPMLRLFLLAEHSGCEEAAPMLRNSRTTFTNPLVRLLSWNMSFHTAHHLSPAIPFYQLAEATSIIGDRCLVTDRGYTQVHTKMLAQFEKTGSSRLKS